MSSTAAAYSKRVSRCRALPPAQLARGRVGLAPDQAAQRVRIGVPHTHSNFVEQEARRPEQPHCDLHAQALDEGDRAQTHGFGQTPGQGSASIQRGRVVRPYGVRLHEKNSRPRRIFAPGDGSDGIRASVIVAHVVDETAAEPGKVSPCRTPKEHR